MTHVNNLNALRLMAASLVVAGHSYVLVGLPAPSWFYMACHSVAVLAFFVVSGYLVSKSWARDPDLGRFVARRALRIMPGLTATVVIAALVIGPLFTTLPLRDYFAAGNFTEYFWNIALAPAYHLPGVFEDGRATSGVNGTLWSLPVEIAMYALMLIYGRAQSRFCRRVLLPLALAGGLFGSFWFIIVSPAQVEPVIWWNSVPFGLRFAGAFAFGVAVNLWALERFLSMQASVLAFMALGLLTPYPDVTESLSLVVLPYAVLSFGLSRTPLLGWSGRYADLSFGVYLWGCPIQQIVISAFGPTMHPLLLLGTSLPLTLAAAYVSWHVIESPALRWKPGRASPVAQPFLAR